MNYNKEDIIFLLKTVSFYASFKLYNILKDNEEYLMIPFKNIIKDRLPELIQPINCNSKRLDDLIEKGLIGFTIDSLNMSQEVNYDETVASLIPYLEKLFNNINVI